MIKRIVLIKLAEEYANEAGRDKVVSHAQRVLPLIPGVVEAEAGVCEDADSADWDVSLVITFERPEDYPRYRDDPDHRAFLEEFLKPRASARSATNFIFEGSRAE